MGKLKAGSTYIYERVDDVVYARETGTATRIEIGRDFDLHDRIMEDKLWGDIRRGAKDNPALQKALDQCILLYKLTEHYENRYGNRKT